MMKGANKMTKLSYLEAIRQAHDLALEKNKNTIILCEDILKKDR